MKRYSTAALMLSLLGAYELKAKDLTFDKPLTFEVKPLKQKDKQALKNRLAFLIKGKMIKHMEAPELKEAADICIKLNDFNDALLYLEQLILTSNSVNEQKDAKLLRADIFFESGLLKKAAEYYEEFRKMYPGDSNVAYAEYKGILSGYYCMLDSERDQTGTQKVINLCNNFIEHKNVTGYVDEVKTIRTQCYQRLFDHEIGVFEHYFKQGKFKAAETRLSNIKKSYENKLAMTAPKVLHCQYRIAQAKGETQVAEELMALLHEQYPSFMNNMINPPKKKVNYLTKF